MKTNAAGVFAAGDIVEFPLFLNDDQQSNIQHWQMAHQHGQCTMARLALFNRRLLDGVGGGGGSEGSRWAENVDKCAAVFICMLHSVFLSMFYES